MCINYQLNYTFDFSKAFLIRKASDQGSIKRLIKGTKRSKIEK